jgi:hemolysin III
VSSPAPSSPPQPSPSETVPQLRGRFHQIAFFVSLPAGAAAVAVAPTVATTLATLVFAIGVSGMFGASAAYHRLHWTPVGRDRIRRLDHSMIFVAIAGTYTPVTLVVLDGSFEIAALAAVWAVAAAGVALKVFVMHRLNVLSAAMYPILGWAAVVALPQILREINAAAVALMFAGGLLYTVGAIVLARRRPDPDPLVFGYHEVWHAFVVGGWACHYAMVMVVLVTIAPRTG